MKASEDMVFAVGWVSDLNLKCLKPGLSSSCHFLRLLSMSSLSIHATYALYFYTGVPLWWSIVSHPGDNKRFTLSYCTSHVWQLWSFELEPSARRCSALAILSIIIIYYCLHMVHGFLEIFKLKSLAVNSPLSDSVLPDRSVWAMWVFFCPFRTFGGHHMNNCFHPFSDNTKH